MSRDFLDRTPLYRQLGARWSAYVRGAAGPQHLYLPAAGRAGTANADDGHEGDVVAAMIAEWPGTSVPA